MYELKPCPFCGGEARLLKTGFIYSVYCKSCFAQTRCYGEGRKQTGKKEAIKAWEMRAENERN